MCDLLGLPPESLWACGDCCCVVVIVGFVPRKIGRVSLGGLAVVFVSLRLALDCTGAKRGHAIGNTVLVKTISMRISLNAYKATFIPTFLSLLEYRNTP